MDFHKLLKKADKNKVKASEEASVERYNSDLPPPKKVPKSNVQSDGIRRFLEKKKAEEDARLAEARKQKEQLLALRAQSTKNSKKAKIMASRTKDNDFSRIKLTDDEIEAKKKREVELIRQNLSNKVERMKARIEMEEKEAMLPRKRKRKSKNGEIIATHDDPLPEVKNDYRDTNDVRNNYKDMKDVKNNYDERVPNKSNAAMKKHPKPPPSTLSFMDLLKIAEKKQHEPLEIVVPQKDDEKLMTKKQRKLMLEEQERLKRKKEREFREKIEKEIEEKLASKYSRAPNIVSSKSKSVPQTANVNKKLPEKTEKSKSPTVVRVKKDLSKPVQETSKFKIPKGTINTSINKSVPFKTKETSISANTQSNTVKPPNPNSLQKPARISHISEQKKPIKPKIDNGASFKDMGNMKKAIVPKKNGLKINPVSSAPVPQQAAPVPQVDEAALEKRIREKLEKEIEERLAAKFGLHMQNLKPPDKASTNDKVPETPKPSVVKKEPAVVNQNNKVPGKPMQHSQKDIERMMAMKKRAMEQKNMMRKLPEKKPFHTNPYLDPPRRLLEPQRPKVVAKRRIESDSDDDDDDDMSDFIDDGPSQNEDDYSKYIQEIFGYDRNKYMDNDDDDIMETSFAEQMKEEIQSAKAGYLEDLEEEKKEQARKKKKKLKK